MGLNHAILKALERIHPRLYDLELLSGDIRAQQVLATRTELEKGIEELENGKLILAVRSPVDKKVIKWMITELGISTYRSDL